MKTSEAFRRTKEHLWDGHWEYRAEKGMTKFICIAAIRAMPHPNHAPQVHRLELIIKKLLGGGVHLRRLARGERALT